MKMPTVPKRRYARSMTASERGAHGDQVGGEPGGFGDDLAVRLGQGETTLADEIMRRPEQLHGVRVLPPRVGVGKELADVAGAGGAEDRIGEGVRHRVGIRVPDEAVGVRHGDATEDERAPRDEAMGVVADPDAGHAATGSSITL
jgi:hypothetical protein